MRHLIEDEETSEDVEAENTIELIEQDEWVAYHYRAEEETY